MADVIRFDIYFRGGVPEVLPSLDGRYMRFDDHEKANARIAELTAEVGRLRLLVKEAYEEGVSDTDAAEEGRWEESHARNALKDGV